MIRRPPRSTRVRSSAASDVYKRQLLAVGFGYFVAGGILALIATALGVTLSGQATSLMVILLFGAGTDYGLLLISRYREELRRESDARVALATAQLLAVARDEQQP